MSEDYIYAVTRVHARETGLLGKNDPKAFEHGSLR